MQVIIRYVGLWQDAVPNLEWHSGIGRKEACNIVVSPGADDPLGDVGSFVVWRHILDGDFGNIAKKCLQTLGCLIVQTLIFGHLVETFIVCGGRGISLDKRRRGTILYGLSVDMSAKVG